MKKLAKRIRNHRIACGWSQEQAAENLGVPVQTYRNWEYGFRAPSSGLALKAVQDWLETPEKKAANGRGRVISTRKRTARAA